MNPYVFTVLSTVLAICFYTIFIKAYFNCVTPKYGSLDIKSLAFLILLLTGCGIYQAFPRYCTVYRLMANIFLPYGLFLVLFSPELLVNPWVCLPTLLAFPILRTGRNTKRTGQEEGEPTRVCLQKKLPGLLSRWIRADIIPFLCLFPIMALCVCGSRYAEYQAAVPANIDDIEEEELSDYSRQLEELAPERWDTLTLDQRRDALQTFAEIESVHLGLEAVPVVTIERIDEKDDGFIENGFYQDQSRSIHISLQLVEQKPFYEVLRTLLHECRHGFQADLCRLYAESLPSRRNLPELRPAAVYIYEFEHYIDGIDSGTYEEYRAQKCETDARTYAAFRLLNYQEFWGDDIYMGLTPKESEAFHQAQ